MAAYGKGDPRWLVSDREDGKNMDYWHWDSKDVTAQAVPQLEQVFTKLEILNDKCVTLSEEQELRCTVERLSQVAGTIHAHVRKGKRFYWFDNVTVSLLWTANVGPQTFAGSLEIRKLKTEKTPEIIAKRLRIVLYEHPTESAAMLEELIAGIQTDGLNVICTALNAAFPTEYIAKSLSSSGGNASSTGTPVRGSSRGTAGATPITKAKAARRAAEAQSNTVSWIAAVGGVVLVAVGIAAFMRTKS